MKSVQHVARMAEDRQQSEFNMAVSYLNRLNGLFYVADDAAIALDAGTWFHTLMALERELSTEMKADERNKYGELRHKVNELLAKNAQNAKRSGRTEIEPELYEALHQYEISIRSVLKEAGLQNKIVDSALKALR